MPRKSLRGKPSIPSDEESFSSQSDHEEHVQASLSSSQVPTSSQSQSSVLQWTEGSWAAALIARYCLSQGNRRILKKEDMYQLLMRNNQETTQVDASLRRAFPALLEQANALLVDICGLQIAPLDNQAKGSLFTLKNKVPSSFIRSNLDLPKDSALFSLLTLILCIIYVNQRSIRLDVLYQHLESCLGLTRSETYSDMTDMMIQAGMASDFHLFTATNRTRGSLEIMINGFIRMGYLDKSKVKNASVDLNQLNSLYDISWGARSFILLSEKKVKDVIAEFYPEVAPETKEKLRKDVDRCSGLELERHLRQDTTAVDPPLGV